MHVLIVGATGYVGGHLARRLLGRGHRVTGTARTPRAAARLRAAGVETVRGDAHDARSLVAAAGTTDAVVYAAAARSFDADHDAVDTLLRAAGRSGRTVLFTSGSAVVADAAAGHPTVDVHDDGLPRRPPEAMRRRVDIERRVVDDRGGARALVLRPPLVHGHGGSVQVPLVLDIARRTGRARYVGEGLNRWSTVHVDDLTDLYELALTRGEPGRLYNAGAGEVGMRALADAVGALLGTGPALSWTADQAAAHSPMARGMGTNSILDSTRTITDLGWRPHRPGVLDDVTSGSYRL